MRRLVQPMRSPPLTLCRLRLAARPRTASDCDAKASLSSIVPSSLSRTRVRSSSRFTARTALIVLYTSSAKTPTFCRLFLVRPIAQHEGQQLRTPLERGPLQVSVHGAQATFL